MREIDTVTVKGSIKPMRLYTITIHTDNMERQRDDTLSYSIKKKKNIRDKIRKDLFSSLLGGAVTTWEVFSSDPDFLELRKFISPKFERTFKIAY